MNSRELIKYTGYAAVGVVGVAATYFVGAIAFTGYMISNYGMTAEPHKDLPPVKGH